MNQNQARSWKVMTWNVRGINSSWKWDSVKNKITIAQCDIVCLQETKKEDFDPLFLRKICPQFDYFDFLPSIGASSGILVARKGSFFSANRVGRNNYALTMKFCSRHNNNK
jgi:exonuclease III